MHTLPIAKAARPSVALFMPAFNEASNLVGVDLEGIRVLDRGRHRERAVIVVNDGSTDKTPSVLEDLQCMYPVEVISHPVNHGLPARFRSGFNAALATGCEWVAFCDSDGQFNPADLALLLVAAYSHDVNVVLGVRAKRADNLARRAAGRGWHGISRLVLKYTAADVDCGFKLLHRTAIGSVADQLQSDYAGNLAGAVAPVYRAGQRFVEIPVPHYPRMNGKQTGLKATVVIRSFVELCNVRHGLSVDRDRVSAAAAPAIGRSPVHAGCRAGGDMTSTEQAEMRPPVESPSRLRVGDHTARWVALFAAILSVCVYAYFARKTWPSATWIQLRICRSRHAPSTARRPDSAS